MGKGIWFRFSSGSYIKSRNTMRARFEKGIKEWPETYLSLGIVSAGIVMGLCVCVPREMRHESWTSRFKKYYTVYRPDDDRLQLYPKLYLTDKQYLAPDHPERPENLTRFLLPPSSVHRTDD